MSFAEYYNKLLHCYYGKGVGGTLGMPFEGQTTLRDLTFYDPVPEEAVGNDDLDLQIVWLECIRRFGLPIHSKILEEGWMTHIRSVWDEYGVAQRNLRLGLHAPLSGCFNNKFTAGYGAAIRTEIWAGLAPANPDLAVKFATADSSVDHTEEGVEASRFLAAFESLAYMEKDLDTIISKALDYVDRNSRIYSSISDTWKWVKECHDFKEVREKIIEKYETQNFTDVCINIPMVLLGLYYGNGDFGKSVCIAVNCGFDTDCNGATTGAIMGLLYPDSITREWLEPIGDKLVLSPYIVGMHQPKTVRDMCMQIAAICKQVQNYYDTGISTDDFPEFDSEFGAFHKPWRKSDFSISIPDNHTSVAMLEPLYIALHYPKDIAITPGSNAEYTLEIISEVDTVLNISAYMPYGWTVDIKEESICLQAERPYLIPVSIVSPKQNKHNYVEHLDITVSGNGLSQNCSFGIPEKMKWLCVKTDSTFDGYPPDSIFSDASSCYCANNYISVPSGNYYYTVDFKSPAEINDAILVAEGNRKMRVWLGDELVSETDGSWYVPASHRGPEGKLNCRKRIRLSPDWKRVTVEVADGSPGEIFLGFFKPYGHEWLEDIETKVAFKNEN